MVPGTAAANAPYAPSTWNHTPASRQISAISESGSTAPVLTDPAVPITIIGRSPASRSRSSAVRSAPVSMRRSAPVGIQRMASVPTPARSVAF